MNASAAKKKVKTHVNRHKDGNNFHLSERHIIYWFGVINRAAFRNKLSMPNFKLCRMRGSWGWCIADGDSITIRINENIDNREMFISTLAHEMVHQYQYQYEGGIMNHTESFREWKRFFKRNMRITI